MLLHILLKVNDYFWWTDNSEFGQLKLIRNSSHIIAFKANLLLKRALKLKLIQNVYIFMLLQAVILAKMCKVQS